MARRVLVLRPHTPGLRTAERLATQGLEAVTAPILRIEPTNTPMPAGPFDAVCVTSAAALHRVGDLPASMKSLPLLAVGERTASLAREAGFTDVYAGEGERHSLAALAQRLFGADSSVRLLLALGQEHKHDTPLLLRSAGVEPVPWIVYAATAVDTLPERAREALETGTLDAVVHYSRRSAVVACELVTRAGLWPRFTALVHCTLSDDVAVPLQERGVARILVANRPHEDALLALFTGIDRPQGSP